MGLIALDGRQAYLLALECQQVEALGRRYILKLVTVFVVSLFSIYLRSLFFKTV